MKIKMLVVTLSVVMASSMAQEPVGSQYAYPDPYEVQTQDPVVTYHDGQQEYTVEPGGIAVLRMSGVIAPKANLFMQVSGGMSTQMATRQLESAITDPRVRAVVLAIDSPGGTRLRVDVDVFGTYESWMADTWPKALQALKALCEGTAAARAA